MTHDEIRTRLYGIIRDLKPFVPESEITDASNVREDIGLESLDFIDLVLQCETMFNISISPEESADIQTVGDMLQLVMDKTN